MTWRARQPSLWPIWRPWGTFQAALLTSASSTSSVAIASATNTWTRWRSSTWTLSTRLRSYSLSTASCREIKLSSVPLVTQSWWLAEVSSKMMMPSIKEKAMSLCSMSILRGPGKRQIEGVFNFVLSLLRRYSRRARSFLSFSLQIWEWCSTVAQPKKWRKWKTLAGRL